MVSQELSEKDEKCMSFERVLQSEWLKLTPLGSKKNRIIPLFNSLLGV